MSAYYLGSHSKDLSPQEFLILIFAIFCVFLLTSGVIPAFFKFVWFFTTDWIKSQFEKSPFDVLEVHRAKLIAQREKITEIKIHCARMNNDKGNKMSKDLAKIENDMQIKIYDMDKFMDENKHLR
jgi:hypothetical protein